MVPLFHILLLSSSEIFSSIFRKRNQIFLNWRRRRRQLQVLLLLLDYRQMDAYHHWQTAKWSEFRVGKLLSQTFNMQKAHWISDNFSHQKWAWTVVLFDYLNSFKLPTLDAAIFFLLETPCWVAELSGWAVLDKAVRFVTVDSKMTIPENAEKGKNYWPNMHLFLLQERRKSQRKHKRTWQRHPCSCPLFRYAERGFEIQIGFNFYTFWWTWIFRMSSSFSTTRFCELLSFLTAETR